MNATSKFHSLLRMIRSLTDRELEAHRDVVDGERERRRAIAAQQARPLVRSAGPRKARDRRG